MKLNDKEEGNMILFDKNCDSPIVLSENADEAVRLAAQDLQNNLRYISGKEVGFDCVCQNNGRGICIRTEYGDKEEAYTVCVDDGGVTITGTDVLGTVFGIYAFSERCLNVSPFYRLADIYPRKCDELVLPAQSFSSGERPVRFRGWFINDEDLLTDFRISGGVRRFEYPFYHNVMDEGVLDMLLEAALRLEINLVIPSSFVDIDNPDEEKLVMGVFRRGMYVSQHHIEPMGVSYFSAEEYVKRRGCEGERISFITGRCRMTEIWRYYAEKWSKYKDRVIWQFGLRGKGDEAVWRADSSFSASMEERGGIISDAIRTQYDIVREILGTDDFYSTATLWNEGSELYGRGYLKLPATTVPIFSDFGFDQMFGEDLFSVGSKTEGKYGVYYHAAFWSRGPHLAEGCSPVKMAYNYRNAAKGGKLCYSILNISNVRPLHISAMINARILKNPESFDTEKELLELDKELFGDSVRVVNELRRGYYAAFADFGERPVREAADAWGFYFKEYGDLPFVRNAATDGHLVSVIKYRLMFGHPDHHIGAVPLDANTRQILKESCERFSVLLNKARSLKEDIPRDRQAYYSQFVIYPILYMYLLTEWCIAGIDLKNAELAKDERRKRGRFAVSCIERILTERRILEEGEWKNWHRGDKKLDIRMLLELTEKAVGEV